MNTPTEQTQLNTTLQAQVERLLLARDAEIVLREKAEKERDEAQKAGAEMREWIEATVENCSVFKDPPALDCGKGFVHVRELEQTTKELNSIIKDHWDDANRTAQILKSEIQRLEKLTKEA